jgi:hypothetical protein
MAAGRGIKRQAWPLTDHFDRLLEEAFMNHAYPIKHRLKDCGMMENFMTSGSLTQGKEPEGDPDRKGVAPFPRDEVVMLVYYRRPHLGRRRVSNLCPRTPTRSN